MRHPAFLWLTTPVAAALLVAIAAMACAGAAAESSSGYRLAGTLAVGQDYIALLEVPEGGQVLVRAGSVVNDVRVLAVSASAVRLALSSGSVELSLESSGRTQPIAASDAGPVTSTGQHGQVYERDVAVDQLSRDLRKPPSAGATGSPNNAVGGFESAQRIAAVLDLPEGSRVLQVGPTKVTSADQAIKAIEAGFAYPDALGVVLDVQTPKGAGRVYLRRAD